MVLSYELVINGLELHGRRGVAAEAAVAAVRSSGSGRAVALCAPVRHGCDDGADVSDVVSAFVRAGKGDVIGVFVGAVVVASQPGQSTASLGSCPLRMGPFELGLMSVAKLQVSLVRLVRSTMLVESLPACLFMNFCELTKPDSSSQSQIGTPLL